MMNIKLNAELMRNSTQVMQEQQQVTDYWLLALQWQQKGIIVIR